MRSNYKLFLVEGLCGTGKSTLAERLHRYLEQQGISSRFYAEGALGHPSSLNGHAFYREEEYTKLLGRYRDTADVIHSLTIKYDSYYLIPYRNVKEFNALDSLYSELESRELCWTDSPMATKPEFTYLIQRHWARFAELASSSDEVYVLEAVFFQHQIHDLLGHYHSDDRHIQQHILGIADRIASMNPMVIYLTQPSVRDQQIWISSIRSKPHVASEQKIRFMENRKRIEIKLLEMLPFPTYTIENETREWEQVFNEMVVAITD